MMECDENLTKLIKGYAKERDVDLVGIASADRFEVIEVALYGFEAPVL